MYRYTLRVFGFPILSLEAVQLEFLDEEDAAHIEGGSAHNFERDFNPLSPTSHHEWDWDDKGRRFGFG